MNIPNKTSSGGLLLTAVLLFLVLACLFHRSFAPAAVLFSNDAPLGLSQAVVDEAYTSQLAHWNYLNWVGAPQPTGLPPFSLGLFFLCGPSIWHQQWPVIFAKFYAPGALLVLGLCAWFCFRRLKFHPAVCVLGALAAALNSNAFSNACWGLPTLALAHGAFFLALAALVSLDGRHAVIKLILAGAATAVGVMEAYDSGAILSLYIAAYVLFLAWVETGQWRLALVQGAGRVAIVALAALLLAAQALASLIGTQIKGVVGTKQDLGTKISQWDFATQWSLPKLESLRVLIPGLFGYRMDTPDGGAYWGAVGQTPGWPSHHEGTPRYSGAGEYAGVLVVLLAAWALAQSFRTEGSPFNRLERRTIHFWGGAALISLLLSFGRHAPFYQFVYLLPYFSTIRNPIKFMHPFQVAVGLLCAFGLEALARVYVGRVASQAASLSSTLRTWWTNASRGEKNWFLAVGVVAEASLLSVLVVSAARDAIVHYMQTSGFDPRWAAIMFQFSLAEIGWYLIFLMLSVGLLVLIVSGFLSGRRAAWAWIGIGAVLVADLARANGPWIVYYDYTEKYATNPIIEVLRQNPYEHRVKVAPDTIPLKDPVQAEAMLQLEGLYQIEWLQQLFPFYRIQALDVVQERSLAEENLAYRDAFRGANDTVVTREWELTNTRYLLGLSGDYVKLLNQQFDPVRKRFQLRVAFDVVSRVARPLRYEDYTAVVRVNGRFGLIEFTGALPRAKLYGRWQTATNDQMALRELASPQFDPHQTVLVADALPSPATLSTQGANSGTVQIAHYSANTVKLTAQAPNPTVLLLNDKYDPSFKVWVDGRPQPLLRCNYLMRGVFLPAGAHEVEFRYRPPRLALDLSLAAMAACLVLGLVLASAPPKAAHAGEAPR